MGNLKLKICGWLHDAWNRGENHEINNHQGMGQNRHHQSFFAYILTNSYGIDNKHYLISIHVGYKNIS